MYGETLMPTKANTTESGGNGQRAANISAVAAAVDGAAPAISREFHNFVSDIEDLVTSMTSLTGDELARARAKVRERVATAKQSVEELGGTIAAQARTTAKATDTYVHHQPWQAIGIGAGVGFLLGFALARRA